MNPSRVDEKDVINYIKEFEKTKEKKIASIKRFATKSTIFLAIIFLLFFIGLIYDALIRVKGMIESSPLLAAIYVTLFLGLVITIFYIIIKQYIGYLKLKKIDSLQQKAIKYLKNPNNETLKFAKEILKSYKNHQNKEISKRAKEIDLNLSEMMYEEILPTINEKIFLPLDKEAQKVITKYSTQTAISTAISPVALIDAILIISRSYAMISEIATIYGYRPTLLGKIALIRKVFITLAFASVTDILSNHLHDFLGSSILSKLSYHSAQGIANGVLTARVGISTIKVCRVIPYSEKNQSFLLNLSKKILNTIFKDKRA